MLLNEVVHESAEYLKELALSHECASHPLFARLKNRPLSKQQAVALLVNYDAHASLLRRLLLTAAAFMPEPAVGFVIENVRNEYGNGDYRSCHQGLLRDLIAKVSSGKKADLMATQDVIEPGFSASVRIFSGVRKYITEVVTYYKPKLDRDCNKHGYFAPAITAGAITATEIMALEEFKAMQKGFIDFGLAEHPWFDHVNVECEHSEESLALAQFFFDEYKASTSVEFGFQKTLAINVHLYDGLLEAINRYEDY